MFRHTYGLTLGLCLLLSQLIIAQEPGRKDAQSGSGFAGKWEIVLTGPQMNILRPMSIKVNGDTFTGSISQWPILDGKINGNEITFKLGRGGQALSMLSGKLYGDQISLLIEDAPGRPGTAHYGIKSSWTAFRSSGSEPLDWKREGVVLLPFATPVSKQDGITASDLTGRFEAPFAWGTKTYTYEFVLEASGDKLTGKAALLGSQETFDIGDGRISGNDISFTWLQAGKPVARFTGTLYGRNRQELALLMQEVGPKRLPEAVGGKIHPMTAFRNDGNQPWYTQKWMEIMTGPAGQVPDPDFDTHVAHPAYTAQHPKVIIDEAHHNFHNAGFGYKPFADLMSSDGYEIERGTQPFTAAGLTGVKVLVISNAMGPHSTPTTSDPAFTQAECDAVREWVRGGGSLLLIADHTPFGAAAESMATGFGVQMGKGFAFVLNEKYAEKENPTDLIFSRDNGLLSEHPITRGRSASERIQKVVTFTGQALSGPQDATAILKLAPTAMQAPSQNELQELSKDFQAAGLNYSGMSEATITKHASPVSGAQGLAMPFGKGRLVVLGEAGFMTAQIGGGQRFGMNAPGNDDRQFALNVMHWLSGALQ